MTFSITKNGIPFTDYQWDSITRTLTTNAKGLVIDFSGMDNYTFKTGPGCTFKTGSYCTFKTGYDCTFNTGSSCTFDTGSNCTFTVGENCVGIRYDVKGIIELPSFKTIKYNAYNIAGFTESELRSQNVLFNH